MKEIAEQIVDVIRKEADSAAADWPDTPAELDVKVNNRRNRGYTVVVVTVHLGNSSAESEDVIAITDFRKVYKDIRDILDKHWMGLVEAAPNFIGLPFSYDYRVKYTY